MKSKKGHIKKLEDIEKTEGFEIPEGYFDQFQTTVFEQIDEQSKEAEKKTKSIRLRTFYALAASVAVFAMSVFIFLQLKNEVQGYDQLLSEVTDEEIITYLDNSELVYYDLTELINNDYLDKVNDFEIPQEETEALLEYYKL